MHKEGCYEKMRGRKRRKIEGRRSTKKDGNVSQEGDSTAGEPNRVALEEQKKRMCETEKGQNNNRKRQRRFQ